MYSGVVESALATAVANYPWYITFQSLQQHIPKAHGLMLKNVRTGVIGFLASISADLASNGIKVIKATKQASAAGELGEESGAVWSNTRIFNHVLRDGGIWRLLFGRGLPTRILANGLQNFVFTIIWYTFELTYSSFTNVYTRRVIMYIPHPKHCPQEGLGRRSVG